MSKDEKCTCKACKNTVFHCQICGAFVAVVVVVCLSYLLGSLSKDDIDKQLERHLKMQFRVSAIISQLLKVITLAKCALTILELNVNQRFRNKKTKLNICHHMLTSSTQLQNTSFYVERTRTSAKCQKKNKIKSARAKRAKLLFFIVKYANLLLPSSSGCLSSQAILCRLGMITASHWLTYYPFQSRYINNNNF